jgi:peptide/nickel transport system substrate-binding protein
MAPPSPIFNARIAELKSQLGAVGIDLVFPAGTVVPNRDFDTSIINFAQGYDPHIGVRRQYHSDQVTTLAATNLAGYKNALVDSAFDQAVKTIDPAERFALYHQFQEQVARDLPYVWLIETPNVRAFTARCSRFKVYTGLFAEGAYCRASASAARRKRARARAGARRRSSPRSAGR